MYDPSITHHLVHEAIAFFCGGLLSKDEKQIIKATLKIQEFSMGNTLITFREKKYYECGVQSNPDDRGITIGGYDSAWPWLADMVAGYMWDV